MKTLDKFCSDLRDAVATAEVLTIEDDVGKMPDELKMLVGKAEHHLDGVKGLLKRMKGKIEGH